MLTPVGNKVFYNKVQNVNRDISVLVLDAFAAQVADEFTDQRVRRCKGVSWRNVPQTKDTWGPLEDASVLDSTPEPPFRSSTEEDESKAAVNLSKPRKGLFVLEALSASGLRSIRYKKEVKSGVGLERIIVNDLEEAAVATIKRNVEFNGVDSEKECVPNQGDAAMVMYQHRTQGFKNPALRESEDDSVDFASVPFDVVDLDPYGSPIPFLDSAMQSVRHGGLLMVTCTDLAVLSGGNSGTCHARYGSMPMNRGKFHHEQALRMVLHCIENTANKYDRVIVPLLSLKLDFYVRMFVRVYTSKVDVKFSAAKSAMIIHSKGCDSFHIQPLAQQHATKVTAPRGPSVGPKCPETGADWSMAGPIWSAPMHNPAFVKHLLKRLRDAQDPVTKDLAYALRVEGVLANVDDELHDVPLFYSMQGLAQSLKGSTPSQTDMYAALDNAGYRASQSHLEPTALKTDAPPEVLWDIMRVHAKTKAQGGYADQLRKVKAKDPVAYKILTKAVVTDVSFTVRPELRRELAARKERGQRYPSNPEANWGPKARAEGSNALQTHPKAKRARVDE
jgi:tRNA (guanine26-N2/guanine27-N2)-dimethyltransferase